MWGSRYEGVVSEVTVGVICSPAEERTRSLEGKCGEVCTGQHGGGSLPSPSRPVIKPHGLQGRMGCHCSSVPLKSRHTISFGLTAFRGVSDSTNLSRGHLVNASVID